MNIVNIAATSLTALACALVLVKSLRGDKQPAAAIKPTRASAALGDFADRWHWAIFALILALGVFLRFYKLSELPAGLHVDEAGAAYDAMSLLNYGADRTGAKYPVYLENFGGGQSIIAAYLMALSYKLLGGFSVFATRLPNALISVSFIPSAYFLCAALRSKKTGLAGAFLAAICPLFTQMLRFGMDCTPMLPFLTAGMAWMLWGIKKHRTAFFALSGLTFGITLYSYAAAYIWLPLFLGLSLFILLKYRKVRLKQILALSIPVFVLAVPLMLFLAVNYGLIQPILTPYFSIPKIAVWRASEVGGGFALENLKNFWMLLLCDDLPYYAVRPYYTMYMMSLPLIALGFYACARDALGAFKQREYDPSQLIFAALIASVIKYFVFSGMSVNRDADFYLCFVVFIALGLREVWRNLPRVTIGIIAAYCLCFGCFARFYFTEYNKAYNPLYLFQKNAVEAIQYAREAAPGDYLYFTCYWSGFCQYAGYIFPLLADEESPYVYQQTRFIAEEAVCYSGANCYLPVRMRQDGAAVWEIYPDCVYVLCEDYATETTYEAFDRLEEAGFTLYDGLPPYRVYYYEGAS